MVRRSRLRVLSSVSWMLHKARVTPRVILAVALLAIGVATGVVVGTGGAKPAVVTIGLVALAEAIGVLGLNRVLLVAWLFAYFIPPEISIHGTKVSIGDILSVIIIPVYLSNCVLQRPRFERFERSWLFYFGAMGLSLVSGWAVMGLPASVLIGSALRLVRVLLIVVAARLLPWEEVGSRLTLWRIVEGLTLIAVSIGAVQFHNSADASIGQYYAINGVQYVRGGGYFGNAGAFGNFCAFVAVLCIYLITNRLGFADLMFACLTFGMSVLGVVISDSRGALIALTVGAVIVLGLRVAHILRAGLVIGAVTFAAGAVLNHVKHGFLEYYVGNRLQHTLAKFHSVVGVNETLGGRLTLWRNTLLLLFRHPAAWLFGLGYKSLPVLGTLLGIHVFTDNNYLQAFAEGGLVGIIAFLALLLTLYLTSRGNALLLGVFGCLLISMVTADALTFWRSLALIMVMYEGVRRGEGRHARARV